MSKSEKSLSWKKIKEVLSRRGISSAEEADSRLGGSSNSASGTSRPWAAGSVVLDQYQIIKVIESGGMGLVYIAFDIKQINHTVLKTYKDRFLPNEAAVSDFMEEAQTWIRLSPHPNVVHAELVLTIENHPFIVSEYVPGDNLRAWIKQHRLTLTQTVDFAIQICKGMSHAYQQAGLIHRDIKPENVMIDRNGLLKITDFGLAKLVKRSFIEEVASLSQAPNLRVDRLALTKLKGGLGTSPYMAPEQFEAAPKVGTEADVYSFGIMLFEMLVGHRPFRDAAWHEMQRQHKSQSPRVQSLLRLRIPVDLANLVLKCLAKEPAQRYSNFETLQTELESLYKEITGKTYHAPEELNETTQCELTLQCMAAGDFNLALSSAEKVLKLNPESAKAWMHKADTLVRMERYDEALKSYDQALEICRRLSPVWNNRGLLVHIMGNDKEALRCYENALKYNADYDIAWNNRALSLFNLERYEEALADLDQAIALKQDYADAWFNRGAVLDTLNQPENALAAFDKVIGLTPHNPRPWKRKAIIFLQQLGQYENALHCFDQVLAIDPKDEDSVGSRQLLLQYLQQQYREEDVRKWSRNAPPDFESAKKWEQVSKGLHQGKDTVLAYELKDRANQMSVLDRQIFSMFELNNYTDTIRLADEALVGDPTDVIAWVYKGLALAKCERWEEGLTCLEHALVLDSKQSTAWIAKGIILQNLGRDQEAIVCFDEALSLGHHYQDVWTNKGNSLKRLERYVEALSCYDQALAIAPNDAATWSNKGGLLIDLERYEHALTCTDRAIELNPRFALAWYHKGLALYKLQRPIEALVALDRAAEFDRRSPEVWQHRAEVLIQLDRLPEAEQAIERAEILKKKQPVTSTSVPNESIETQIAALQPGIESNPDRLSIALKLQEMNRPEESLSLCEAILALEPVSAPALWLKVAALEKMNRMESVLDCVDALLVINPNNPRTWHARGRTLRLLGRELEALESFDEALQYEPGNMAAVIWNEKGVVFEKIQRFAEASQSYDEALKIDPRFDLAWVNKGVMLRTRGKIEEAIQCYDRALAINPTNDAAWNNKGTALTDLGAADEEILLCYVRVIQLDPNNAIAMNNIGTVYLRMKRYIDALEYFQRATTLHSGYLDAFINKARALSGLGRLNEALECFDQALHLDPNYAEAWVSKGTFLGNQGKIEEAIKCLDQSLALDSTNHIPWFNKGALLFNANRHNEALSCFEQALAIVPNNQQVREVYQACLREINSGNLSA